MTAASKKKAGHELPTAKVIKRTPSVKPSGTPSEARRKRVHDRLKDSFFANDELD